MSPKERAGGFAESEVPGRNQFVAEPLRVSRAYEELAAVIREQIVKGELSKGEQVPSEAELAKAAQVSRSTVREALRTLEVAGFIERSSPRIMVVAKDLDEPASREVRRALGLQRPTFNDVYEVLVTLEPELTRMAAIRADTSDVQALEAEIAAQRAALDDFEAWNRLDIEFHLMIAEMSANAALILARAPIAQLALETMRGFIDSTTMTSRATQFHERMLDAIRERDGEAAALITRRHVDDFRQAWEEAGIRLDAQIGIPPGRV
jgi:GntR family transcriptional regulator, transcriptional repressor for pyruvate dehydrogenase complex